MIISTINRLKQLMKMKNYANKKRICSTCGSEMRRRIFFDEAKARLNGKAGWACLSPKCKTFVFDEFNSIQDS